MKRLPVRIRTANSVGMLLMATIPAMGETVQTNAGRFVVTAVTHYPPGDQLSPVAELICSDVTPQWKAEEDPGDPSQADPKPNRKARRAKKPAQTD
jgi:hypothetical protein